MNIPMLTTVTKALLLSTTLLLHCGQTQLSEVSSPFEYREVYLREPPLEEGKKLHLNSVDRDWGIWGHNLSKVIPQNSSQSIYAKSGNTVNREQFCFTSDALFNSIKKYIDQYYGRDKQMRFAILPNDNSIVCTCSECTKQGNTNNDASGAVFNMLERLAKEFPKHLFFTSYYSTTRSLPTHEMPDNTGVLISSMSYPLCAVHTPQEDEFEALLKQWAKFTKHVYVWDYINNFDDYLTPCPIFDVAQRRLQLYARCGVKGVFFNGSGPDYSTFYRLKTHILSAMLIDPDIEWRPILRDLCDHFYPVSSKTIGDFIIKQEDMFTASGKTIPLYEGVAVAAQTYLPVNEFIEFHDEILRTLPQIKDPERISVELMRRATIMTRLELMRINADTVGSRRLIDGLQRLTRAGVTTYSESGGSIESYINDYQYMLDDYDRNNSKNILKGVQLEPLTALDESYNDISILTDGMLGLPSSYHCGQMLSSADPALRLAIPNVKGIKRLRINMTRNLIYHIELPQSISLSAGGRQLGSKVPKTSQGNLQRAVVEFDIPSDCKETLILTVVRNKNERTMALDEIEGFRK